MFLGRMEEDIELPGGLIIDFYNMKRNSLEPGQTLKISGFGDSSSLGKFTTCFGASHQRIFCNRTNTRDLTYEVTRSL